MNKFIYSLAFCFMLIIGTTTASASEFFSSQKETLQIINETLEVMSKAGIDGLWKYTSDQIKILDSTKSEPIRALSRKKIWYAMSLAWYSKNSVVQRMADTSSAAYEFEKKDLDTIGKTLTGVGTNELGWNTAQIQQNYQTTESLFKARMTDIMSQKPKKR